MNGTTPSGSASLLTAEGMERVDDVATADVVVLNTCCIRQNADDKLYGNLGHLKTLQSKHQACRSPLGVASLRRIVSSSSSGPARERGLRHPQRRPGRGAGWTRARPERISAYEILEAPANEDADGVPGGDGRPVGPGPCGPGSRSRSAATTRAPSASCRPVRGPGGEPALRDLVAEVRALAERGTVEITLLGQNVNSYGRT